MRQPQSTLCCLEGCLRPLVLFELDLDDRSIDCHPPRLLAPPAPRPDLADELARQARADDHDAIPALEPRAKP